MIIPSCFWLSNFDGEEDTGLCYVLRRVAMSDLRHVTLSLVLSPLDIRAQFGQVEAA